jgi:hypothetical protein
VSDEFVTVATFDQSVEAHLARSKLESEGIPCFVSEERFIQVNWLLASAFGGVKLKVPSVDVERARNVLRPRPRLVIVADADSDGTCDDEVTCPRCRSYDVYDHHLNRRVGVIAVAFLSFVGRSWRRRRICKQCGYGWKDGSGKRPDRLGH